jgi:hypothetical protein
MSKVRKSPTIVKPTIDEKTALQFAAGGSPPQAMSATHNVSPVSPGRLPAKKPVAGDMPGKTTQVLITLKKDLYERIVKDASRKNRTLEEHLVRHLTKRYGK